MKAAQASPQVWFCRCGHAQADHSRNYEYVEGIAVAETYPCITEGCACEDFEASS